MLRQNTYQIKLIIFNLISRHFSSQMYKRQAIYTEQTRILNNVINRMKFNY